MISNERCYAYIFEEGPRVRVKHRSSCMEEFITPPQVDVYCSPTVSLQTTTNQSSLFSREGETTARGDIAFRRGKKPVCVVESNDRVSGASKLKPPRNSRNTSERKLVEDTARDICMRQSVLMNEVAPQKSTPHLSSRAICK